MNRIRVGVLRGGPSREYEVSLKTGSSVLRNLSEDKYDTRDILITKDGTWHYRGLPVEPKQVFLNVDVIFNALHGEYGEDGQVQRILSHFNVPYTGSRSFQSAVCMNKARTKEGLFDIKVQTARHVILDVSEDIEKKKLEVFRTFPQPCVIKPLSGGSSVGVTAAKDHSSFDEGIRKAFEYSPRVLIEEYIAGREATCGVIENFRDRDVYSLLPTQIIPDSKQPFFDYEAKYQGKSRELCPGNFSKEENRELQRLAREIHKTLDLRHYSRSDFIISNKGIYFLEVNTLPGLTEASLISKSLGAVGSSLPEFLDHVISLALEEG